MAKYYGTGTKQIKTTEVDESGKKVAVNRTANVIITFDESHNINQRVKAVNAAERLAKKDKIKLDGVYIVQGTKRGGSTMTKNAKQRKLEVTLQHKANRKKKLKKA